MLRDEAWVVGVDGEGPELESWPSSTRQPARSSNCGGALAFRTVNVMIWVTESWPSLTVNGTS